ncbi:hypothetical protein ANN_19769 [Periplaneta americana]|uniref:Per a allergen n=1 Tax=Periplaneta americana TaxID=6978 RepID=A0ABQ8SAT1_PERAM|nr:hypothetical protein ANN_19769 [Periplaneta americana]
MEDNIKMDLSEVGYDDREWINLAGLCEVGNEPVGSLKANTVASSSISNLQYLDDSLPHITLYAPIIRNTDVFGTSGHRTTVLHSYYELDSGLDEAATLQSATEIAATLSSYRAR